MTALCPHGSDAMEGALTPGFGFAQAFRYGFRRTGLGIRGHPLFHAFLREATRTPTIFGGLPKEKANPYKKWPSSAQHHSQVLRFNLITRSASPKARKPELGCGRSIGEKSSGTWFCVVVRQQAGVLLVSLLVCLLLKTGYLFKRVGLFRPFPRNPCFKHVPGWIWGNYREFTG